ncbi:dTDP-4-dehydrorhamnose 3,5-epimerase [Kerstersia sp.]|uniref:dTDP-4-dehydrorhamnose 3,5-epimerase n=1 Tax=Kerstersia sp. TaxID=1930783 RepID=UPI003F909372
MQIQTTSLPGVIVLHPKIHADARGYFLENMNLARLRDALALPALDFVQENLSQSCRHVLRGLHFQREPHAQGKLISVTAGEIFDVAVDIRPGSPTFGLWAGTVLSASNRRLLWVPPGFAHGFLTLSEQADCLYRTTHYWHAAAEGCIRWDDPALAIDWPLSAPPILSARDQAAPLLHQAALSPLD